MLESGKNELFSANENDFRYDVWERESSDVGRNKKFILISLAVFLAWEYLLYNIMYNVDGGFSVSSFIFVYSSCMFCALFAERSAKYLFTQIGLACTVGADFFLVLIPEQERVPGMFFFCIAQTAYFCRLYFSDKNATRRRLNLILRAVASALAVPAVFLVLGPAADAVAVLSIFYYVNLIFNVIFAIADRKNQGVFALALLLFIWSDTIIGINNLNAYLPAAARSAVYHISRNSTSLIYMLYLPSQVLISASMAQHRWKSISEE